RSSRDRHYAWATSQLEKRRDTLRETFLREVAGGYIDEEAMAESAEFFGLAHLKDISLMIISPELFSCEQRPLPDYSLRYALEGALGDVLDAYEQAYMFADDSGNVLALIDGPVSDSLAEQVMKVAKTGLAVAVNTAIDRVNSLAEIPAVYDRLLEKTRDKAGNPDAVEKARAYIYNNFTRQDLGLDEVASHVKVNPAYLSRVMKRSLGVGFSRFLTLTRIEHAVRLMNNKNLLLRDIAERVGYSSPFYFSTAFKKVLGVSPAEYRNEGGGR
ncbi:MAG: AraC family transcriptional regulator, partial [Clostridia bacterium]|nr:AraC family transcriptional regulator [Clostridia bacterium]